MTLVYCEQTAGWIKTPLGTDVGLGPCYIVLDGDLAPPKRGTASEFLVHVCYGQLSAWIKMPLGTEVGLGPGDIVLDGDPAPPKRGTAPHFLAHDCCGQTAGWIKMPLGTKVDFSPGHIVLDGDQVPPPPKNGGTAPHFRPMCIVGKRLPISATAEHLFFVSCMLLGLKIKTSLNLVGVCSVFRMML